MSEENQDKVLFGKMLDKVLEISKVSYDQENDRSKQLLNKSDFLIKYISAITIFVNIFLPLAFANKIINLTILILMYFSISIFLISSLFFSIRVQILKPGKFLPTGKRVLEEIKNNNGLHSDLNIKNRFIMYYSSSTEALQESNDDRAKILKSAYKHYITSMIILVVAILVIMILVA